METRHKISSTKTISILNKALDWAECNGTKSSEIIALPISRQKDVLLQFEQLFLQTKITSFLQNSAHFTM